MNLLSAESISKSFGDRWLFHEVSLGIARGEKLCMVGSNGTGKSTFLKVLTGEIEPDTGSVSVREGVRLGYLTQTPDVDDATPVRDILFHAGNDLARAVRDYEECLANPDTSSETMQAALQRMEELHAWDYETRIHEVTEKLGIPGLDRSFGTLSGGQQKRVFLAQLLLGSPDLIIMDEPTNHLDLAAIEWLESYLSAQSVSLIMVTHDRYFLDAVATEIVELDGGKLYRYKGNYAWFLEKKAEREEMLRVEVTKARQLLRKELEWMRRQPKARGTKAKYRIEAFHELEKKAFQNLKKDKLELDVHETRQGGKILEVHHLTKRYGAQPIVDDFSYTFKKGDRIGVVGKNGAGKSTFLDLLTGRVAPDGGEVIRGTTTRFGYFTQEAADLNPAHRVIEEVTEIAEFITLSDGSQVSASKFLDNFLFPPEKQYNFVSKLSGGERKRLQLLKVLVTQPNFLILDEPTNDFDIDTLNVLEDFLENFSGCLMLVSHDRYFMDHLVDQLFVFEGEGTLTVFNGNYTDYRTREDAATRTPAPTPPPAPAPPREEPARRKASFREKQEFERLQQEIDELEQRKAAVTGKLSTGTTDHAQLTAWSEEIQTLTDEIDRKTLRWLELSEIVG